LSKRRWLESRRQGGQTKFNKGTQAKMIAIMIAGMMRAMMVSDI
jgi:hypothetical protein